MDLNGTSCPMRIFCHRCSPPVYSSISSVLVSLVLNFAQALVPNTSRYQLFFCPGEIRCVLSVKGKTSPDLESFASQSSVALSHVSQGTIRPFPSGRFGMILDHTARTFKGIQPALKGTEQTCGPRSPMQPDSPLNSIIRFQLISLAG